MRHKMFTLGKTEKAILALIAAALLSIPLVLGAGEPANVTGVKANTINETSIGLSWDEAKDAQGGLVNHYRIYYGVSSVQALGQGEYDQEINTPNNNTSYIVGNLTAGTTYYFAMTAIDSNNLESEAYSLEVSAATTGSVGAITPEADKVAPTVARVTAPYKTEVVVEFSEAVKLPAQAPEAVFTITEQLNTSKILPVKKATIDSRDKSGKSVVLETDAQALNTNYVVTAGVAITDVAGNPIISGNTDSGLFAGSVIDKPADAIEPIAPLEESIDCKEDMNCFYNNLKTCKKAKVNSKKDQQNIEQAIGGAENSQCGIKYNVTSIVDPAAVAKDLECKLPMGNLEARVNKVTQENKTLFTDQDEAKALCFGSYLADFSKTLPVKEVVTVTQADKTPPENIRSLVLSFKKQVDKFMVIMNWKASLNSAKDLVDQIFYMSMDRGKTYGVGASLGSAKTTHEVNDLEAGKEYTFKITTKDAAGNESTGVVKSIRLPKTGVGVGLLLLGSVLGARRVLRRRQK